MYITYHRKIFIHICFFALDDLSNGRKREWFVSDRARERCEHKEEEKDWRAGGRTQTNTFTYSNIDLTNHFNNPKSLRSVHGTAKLVNEIFEQWQ